MPNAAVVVEDRYSAVFKLEHVRPAVVADGLGEAAARFPTVPIVFAETRPLAQEWTYRFLAAAVAHHHEDVDAAPRVADLPPAGAGATAGTDRPREVRAWARGTGLAVTDRGRLPPDVWAAYARGPPVGRRRRLRRPPLSGRRPLTPRVDLARSDSTHILDIENVGDQINLRP